MEMGSAYKILGEVDISDFTEYVDINNPTWPDKKDDLRSSRYVSHIASRSIIFRWTERVGVWPEIHPYDYDIWHTKKEAIKKICSFASDKPPLNFMIAGLEPKSKIGIHYDAHPFFTWARRVHVPLNVPEGVQFIIDGMDVPLKAGTMFEISNTRLHEVINPSNEYRYHIIMDFPP